MQRRGRRGERERGKGKRGDKDRQDGERDRREGQEGSKALKMVKNRNSTEILKKGERYGGGSI